MDTGNYRTVAYIDAVYVMHSAPVIGFWWINTLLTFISRKDLQNTSLFIPLPIQRIEGRMVLLLDGNAEIAAHVRGNLCSLIY